MEPGRSSHTVNSLQVHLVWITKYRYQVLQGDIQLRCRDILRQVCNSLDIQILKGVVGKDHIHLHLSYLPSLSISDIVRRLKGRSSRLLMQEFPELKRRYWGNHFWGIGYGCWSTGHITDEMLTNYLNHHKDTPNSADSFILE
jgi:putative transposase